MWVKRYAGILETRDVSPVAELSAAEIVDEDYPTTSQSIDKANRRVIVCARNPEAMVPTSLSSSLAVSTVVRRDRRLSSETGGR